MIYITVARGNRWFRWQVIIVKVNGNGWWPLEERHYWFRWTALRAKRRLMQ